LFRLFRFNTETESFDVSIEPKQTGDQPKQFDREHILLFFYRKCRVFPVFFYFFGFIFVFTAFFGFFVLFRFSVCFETVCFGCFASIPKQRVSIEPKQTVDPPKQLKKESIFGNFFENLGLFRFVSVFYETDLFVSVVSIWVRNTEKNRTEPKFIFICFEDTLAVATLCTL
jgi:hypothetical protein